MSDEVTNELIYETRGLHTQYHLETKERLGFLEQQYASISRRVACIDGRLERVERRLDLVET